MPHNSTRWSPRRCPVKTSSSSLPARERVSAHHGRRGAAGQVSNLDRLDISLIADALGIERDYEVDLLGTYKRQADPRQIVERGRAAWSSHGISEQQALETASKYTWAATSPRSTAP